MLPPEAALTQNSPQVEGQARLSGRPLGDAGLLATLIAIGAVLRFLFLTKKSFWFDEGVSVQIARLDWYNFVRILWRREANMSLYYLLLRGWLHIGHSEFFIRGLSVVASLTCIPAIYWLGRQLFDRRVGLIAAALLTFNAYAIRYAQEARAYSLFVFLALLSCIYFIQVFENPSRRNRILHILASSLAMYAHFYAGLLIIGQWLSLRLIDPETVPGQWNKDWRKGWRHNWKWIAILSGPALLFATTTGVGPLSWIKRPGFKALYEYFEHIAGNGGVFLVLAYLAACGVALAPFGHKLLQRRVAWATWRYQFLLLWLLFPLAFTVAVSILRPMFVARYFVFCLPALILLAAAGLARIPRTWLLLPAGLLFLGLSLKGTLSYYDHDFDLERDDWRAASYYVLNHARPGDIVMFHIAMGRMPYEFYNSIYPARGLSPAVIYPAREGRINYRDFMGKPGRALIESVPTKYDRVWVVLKDNQTKAGNLDLTTETLNQIFAAGYVHEQITEFPGIEVRFYSDRAAPQ